MKKFTLFILLLFSAFILYAGGEAEQKSGEMAKETGEIAFMVGGAPNEVSFFENNVITKFEEESGRSVKLIRQTTQTEQRKQSLLVALRAKETDPDIMLVDVGWIGQFAASDWLLNLNQYNVDTEPFFQSIIELADTYNGELIGLPIYIDAGLLYYRSDLLEEYGYDGPPQTWMELKNMAQEVQSDMKPDNSNFWGFVWQGAQYEGLTTNALEYFVSAGGGFMLGDNNEVIVDSENNLKALQYMVNLVQDWKISPPNTYTDMKEEEVRMVFQNGNALFERNWPYAYGLHSQDDSAVMGKFDVSKLPHFEGENSAACLGGWHAVISKYTDVPEGAVKFLEFITSSEIQTQFALNLGWNPGREQVYSQDTIANKLPHLVKLKDVFVNAVPRPTVPYYTQMSQAFQKHVNAALAGNKSPAQALKDADAEITQIVEENE
jgi:multiple sugar transport system substrate-binding protein